MGTSLNDMETLNQVEPDTNKDILKSFNSKKLNTYFKMKKQEGESTVTDSEPAVPVNEEPAVPVNEDKMVKSGEISEYVRIELWQQGTDNNMYKQKVIFINEDGSEELWKDTGWMTKDELKPKYNDAFKYAFYKDKGIEVIGKEDKRDIKTVFDRDKKSFSIICDDINVIVESDMPKPKDEIHVLVYVKDKDGNFLLDTPKLMTSRADAMGDISNIRAKELYIRGEGTEAGRKELKKIYNDLMGIEESFIDKIINALKFW